jgi:hypothetical protein
MPVTPQQYTIDLAKRLRLTAMIAEGLLWCAFVMRSRVDLDAALRIAIRTAEHVTTAPIVPDLQGGEQRRLLRSLQRALRAPNGPDWTTVEAAARELSALLTVDVTRIPSGSSLPDFFGDRRALQYPGRPSKPGRGLPKAARSEKPTRRRKP